MGLNYIQGKPSGPVIWTARRSRESYINRLTFETGNPYLKPTKMQTVEYMAQWQQFFAQLSYTYFKDGVYHVTEPYVVQTEKPPSSGRTILTIAIIFQAFVGGQFKVGVWQPRVNAGVMKQWLTLPVDGKPMKMNTPRLYVPMAECRVSSFRHLAECGCPADDPFMGQQYEAFKYSLVCQRKNLQRILQQYAFSVTLEGKGFVQHLTTRCDDV